MALEQFDAFLVGSKESPGATVSVGPDQFPMLESSELKDEHHRLAELIETRFESGRVFPLKGTRLGREALSSDVEFRTRLCLALLERIVAHEARLAPRTEHWAGMHFFGYGGCSDSIRTLIDQRVDDAMVIPPLLKWLSIRRGLYYETRLISSVLNSVQALGLSDRIRKDLVGLRSQLTDGDGYGHNKRQVDRIDGILGDGIWQTIIPGEYWSDQAIADIQAENDVTRPAWCELLSHCCSANSAKPTAKWKKSAVSLLNAVGCEELRAKFIKWSEVVDQGKSRPALSPLWESTDERQRIHDQNANLLRGLLWLCVSISDAEICRSICRVALSSYRKARGIGPRAVKVGNAAVFSLGEIASDDAVAQLAILKVRVKFGTAQKGIEKALVATAERVGIPRDELEEMSVPAYGLTDVGLRTESLGDFTARFSVAGQKPELLWFKPDGKQQKTVPKAVKDDFSEELKELKQTAKDIEKMLPAQSARIEQTYLDQREWELPVWTERYLNHPLVGTLVRRLIWSFLRGRNRASAIWTPDGFVDSRNKSINWPDDSTKVRLWHPLEEKKTDSITAWREWLVNHEIRQPFKQAHREVYILTDAERNTGIYSNRFAAHVLKQHQFNALCAARNWKNTLRLMVDDEFPPAHIRLPAWNLRAEFWFDGAGDEYGTDTNEAGTYLYLTTDQVRFYSSDAATNWAHAGGGGYTSSGTDRDENHPLDLEKIPPLIFSEVMRDVDLFVGVASVGNDPNWADGGPEGRYRDYWSSFSFGELSATAGTRKSVLEGLIPRLKIADRCSFSDRFLIVQGDIRTYRIHLGSGNILMEPNDEYLCIVPKQNTAKSSDVFLPFEGDNKMSIILSKALMLADDTKIKDPTIVSQITPN